MNKKIIKKTIYWLIFVAIVSGIFLMVLAIKGFNETGVIFFFKDIFLDNFFGINAVLLGLLTLIGYLILKRGIADSIVGALKTMIGLFILSIGAGTLVGMAKPVFEELKQVTGSATVALDPYLGWSSANDFLKNGISAGHNLISIVSYALLIGFAFNIILIVFKKWTNVHTLMVTGHIMFQQTSILAVAVYVLMFRNVPDLAGREIGTILFTGIAIGTYWGVASGTSMKGAQKITHNAGFAVGHQQMFGAAIAYKLGKFIGSAKNSAETRKMSKQFKIFEDNIFTQTIIVLSLFLTLIMIIQFSPTTWHSFSNNKSFASWKNGDAYWVWNIILGSMKIVGSILVIITGVRMFVTELQQAFQGISEKIIPGAAVAVDCAATYGFSPNSVTYGFVAGVIGQFTAVAIVIGISIGTNGSIPIVVPLFITLFFNSGTLGVFANASGGWKAAIIIPMAIGFLEIFMASIATGTLARASASSAAAGASINGHSVVGLGFIGMADWNLIWGAIFSITGNSATAAKIVLPVFVITMLFIAQITDNTLQTKRTIFQKMFRLSIEKDKIKLRNSLK